MEYLNILDKNFLPIGMLVEAFDVERKRRINSDNEITFLVPMDSEDYLEKIQLKGHIQDERGQYYTINERYRDRQGKKLTARILCTHIMFKLMDFKMPYTSYVEEGYGIHISVLTNKITAATNGKFHFALQDDFGLRDIKDFGRGDALQALHFVIEKYGCEIEADNFTIKLRKKIGRDSGHQYRVEKNIISNTFKDSGRSLVTRMFAQMKDGRTWIGEPATILTDDERALLSAVPGAIVNGKLAVNYLISPFAASWANSTSEYFDGEMIDQNIEEPEELLEATRKALKEAEIPDFEVSVNEADIFKIDSDETRADLGDTVYLIDPEMGLNKSTARVVELTEYPFARDKHTQVQLANYMSRDFNDIMSDLNRSKKITDDIMSGGRLRADVFEQFAKQAVIDINNSKTEVKYDERGIVLQDRTNANNQVVMTSNGIMVSIDGSQTAKAAITARGVIAEQIIGVLGDFVSMKIGSGNNVTQINTSGIAAGHANFNSAPFRVDMQGNVIANRLTANSAKINSSMFNDGEIVGSSINVGNGVFTVDKSGHVDALSGNFRGIIQALGGSFAGDITATGTITGGTIKGAKIEGGQIISNTSINVTTDVIVGNIIEFRGSGSKGLVFYNEGHIRFPGGGTMELSASTQVVVKAPLFVGNQLVATQDWVKDWVRANFQPL